MNRFRKSAKYHIEVPRREEKAFDFRQYEGSDLKSQTQRDPLNRILHLDFGFVILPVPME